MHSYFQKWSQELFKTIAHIPVVSPFCHTGSCIVFAEVLQLHLTVWHELTRRMKPNAAESMSAGSWWQTYSLPTAFPRTSHACTVSAMHWINSYVCRDTVKFEVIHICTRWVTFGRMYKWSAVGFAQQGSGCDLAHRCSIYLPWLCLTFPVLASQASQNSQWQALAAVTNTHTLHWPFQPVQLT